jgi:hypothetical protein
VVAHSPAEHRDINLEDEDEDYYQEDGTEGEVDSKAKRDKFEQQKKEFKMRMMHGQKA